MDSVAGCCWRLPPSSLPVYDHLGVGLIVTAALNRYLANCMVLIKEQVGDLAVPTPEARQVLDVGIWEMHVQAVISKHGETLLNGCMHIQRPIPRCCEILDLLRCNHGLPQIF